MLDAFLLLSAIAVFRVVLRILIAMKLVQFLLCIREDAALEGSPLSSNLGSAGLNKLNSLAHIDSAHGLGSIAL